VCVCVCMTRADRPSKVEDAFASTNECERQKREGELEDERVARHESELQIIAIFLHCA
jgi:hypothetical protein